jgi:signal transduction histidine kinase
LIQVHKLLARQLRQCFGSTGDAPAELGRFVSAVEQAYLQSDEDRAQLERSMDTVSLELIDRYRRMCEALADSERAKEEQGHAFSVLSAALESTTDGILVVDRHGRMERMNRKFIELWRIPPHIEASRDDGEALAWVAAQLVDPAQFLAKVQELYGQPDAESFDVLHFKDGRIYERYSLPQRVGTETVGRVWSFRDISARQRLEEELRQAQKMEAIGVLAGGVAHDFNNLLTIISGHAELLRESVAMSPDDASSTAEIAAAASRAAMLTGQLLAFSRKQMLQPAVLDLNAVIGSLTPMLGRLIGENIVMSVNSRAGLGVVVADPGQIQQVLMNLVVNARDAMPNGGRVEIAAENVTTDARSALPGEGEVPAGDYVRLSVADTGEGIPPEARARIFEPFFTTKGPGRGTGLGLSTVFGIVRQSGGHISVASDAGAGTVFTIHLPRTHGSAMPAIAANPAPQTLGGSETILLTEDEAGVRALTARLLRGLGYTVLTASDAQQAAQLLQSHEGPVDLLVTDVIMPGLSGPRLAAEIRRSHPAVRTLYMSGYTNDEIERCGGLGEGAVLLEKPFTRERLDLAVRAALSRP